jgi:hypothetical protein
MFHDARHIILGRIAIVPSFYFTFYFSCIVSDCKEVKKKKTNNKKVPKSHVPARQGNTVDVSVG